MTAPTPIATARSSADSPAGHGTPSRYTRGCRCDACRAASRTYRREARRRRTARLAAGVVQVEHGRLTTYKEWGCRCDDCQAANRAAVAAYREGLRVQLDSGEAGVDHGTLDAYSRWGCRCDRCRAARHVASCQTCATADEAMEHRAWGLAEPVPVCLCDVAEPVRWGGCRRCGMPVAALMAAPVRRQAHSKWPRLLDQAVATPDQPADEDAEPDVVVCRVCGCSDDRPCPGGCVWVPPPDLDGDLCSACADRGAA